MAVLNCIEWVQSKEVKLLVCSHGASEWNEKAEFRNVRGIQPGSNSLVLDKLLYFANS